MAEQTPYHITVIGKYQDGLFQKFRVAAEYLAEVRPEITCTVEAYFETQYEQRLKHIVAKYGSSFKQARPMHPLIYAETEDKLLYFASSKRFFDWAAKRFKYEDRTTEVLYHKTKGRDWMKKAKESSGRSYCTLTFATGAEEPQTGEVQIELFDEECPVLVQNFLGLLAKQEFQGHKVHRVKPRAWVQAGDLQGSSGLHSQAAEGGLLRHESFRFAHDSPGVLGMANHGKDTNGSQFYVTARPLPFLDGKFVVFGRVIGGMRHVYRLAKVPTRSERPVEDILVGSKADETVIGSVRTTVVSHSLASLKAAGFPVDQLKAGLDELKGAGFFARELEQSGYAAGDLRKAGYAAAGYSPEELLAKKFKAPDLKATGYSIVELKAGGFSAKDLKEAGYSAGELRAGFFVDELAAAGFSAAEVSEQPGARLLEKMEERNRRALQLRDANMAVLAA